MMRYYPAFAMLIISTVESRCFPVASKSFKKVTSTTGSAFPLICADLWLPPSEAHFNRNRFNQWTI